MFLKKRKKSKKYQGCNVQHDYYSQHCCMIYKKVKRVNSKSSHHKEKIFLLYSFLLFLLYLYEKTDVSWIYYGNYFTVYTNQTIMFCVLNWCRDVCQLFLNKTGKKIHAIYFIRLDLATGIWHICHLKHGLTFI